MHISAQTGQVRFDNLIIHKGLSEDELVKYSTIGKLALFTSVDDWKTYNFLYAKTFTISFALLFRFNKKRLWQLTLAIGHPDSLDWDDETPDRIAQDRSLLEQFLLQNFGVKDTELTFNWGKVELAQDGKNAGLSSIVITYF